MKFDKLKYWIIALVVMYSVYSLRENSLLGFNFKKLGIGSQRITLIIGYIVIIPTIIYILGYKSNKE